MLPCICKRDFTSSTGVSTIAVGIAAAHPAIYTSFNVGTKGGEDDDDDLDDGSESGSAFSRRFSRNRIV